MTDTVFGNPQSQDLDQGLNVQGLKNARGQRFENLSLKDLDLAGAQIFDCVFRNCDFQDCNLSDAQLVRCTLSSCTLAGTNLENASFEEVTFAHCHLANLNLEGALVGKCRFEEGNLLEGLLLKKAIVECCEGLSQTRIRTSNLSSCLFLGCDVFGWKIEE